MAEACQVTLYVADPLRPRLVLQPWEAPTSVDTQLDLLILLLACSIMFNNFHLQLEDSLHLSAINENRCLRTRRGSYPQFIVSCLFFLRDSKMPFIPVHGGASEQAVKIRFR